jgi:death-on-curing protein
LAAEESGIEYINVEDLVTLAAQFFRDPSPVRDIGLLGSAAARPATSAFGADAYPDIWLKAAALLQSIVKNHPLVDGNKRLGWLATAVFLELNGVEATHASNEDVYDFVMGVAAGHESVSAIAEGLRRIVEPVKSPWRQWSPSQLASASSVALTD